MTERRGLMRVEFANAQYLKKHVEGGMLHGMQLNYVDRANCRVGDCCRIIYGIPVDRKTLGTRICSVE